MVTRKGLAILGMAGLLIVAGVWRQAEAAQQQGHPKSGEQEQDHSSMPGMQGMPGMDSMPGMDMSGDKDSGGAHTQADAMRAMQPGHQTHMDGAHMRMTAPRTATPDELQRGDQIAATLRDAIEKYKDYRVAVAEGYRIFLPNVPQTEYHFTNYWNGFLEGFTFDPARPTSLLYRKTKDGWELVGAMYTAPKNARLDQLNERVPLGIARWHAHTNLCMPARDQMAHADWTHFGLTGSISTPAACSAAGGRFYPQIFGWMVHVYPFENTREKIFGQ